MTFSRIKTHGWQVNEKVTSPQLNQLDLDHSNAVDKTGDNAGTGGPAFLWQNGALRWHDGRAV